MSEKNNNSIYEYDEHLKQYRRKYPRAKIQPITEKTPEISDIYSTVDNQREVGKEKRRYRPISSKILKGFFWILFICSVFIWIFFLFYAFKGDTGKKISNETESVPEEEFVVPKIPERN